MIIIGIIIIIMDPHSLPVRLSNSHWVSPERLEYPNQNVVEFIFSDPFWQGSDYLKPENGYVPKDFQLRKDKRVVVEDRYFGEGGKGDKAWNVDARTSTVKSR
jgi:hypothetical protein